MKLSVTINFDSAEDAIEGIARLRGVGRAENVRPDTAAPAKPAEAAPETKAVKDPKEVKAAKDQAAKEAKVAAASTAPAASSPPTATAETAPAAPETKVAETSASSTASVSAAPDYAPIGAAIKAAAATHREGLVALLAKFGAKKGTELKPEQYEPFSTELAALVAPPDDLG